MCQVLTLVACFAPLQAVACIKAIETGWVHPTLNQHNLIDEVAGIDTVPNVKQQHKVGAKPDAWTENSPLSSRGPGMAACPDCTS